MKIKNIILSLIIFTLTACVQAAPAPTATSIPPITMSTEIPIPTKTPLPSPTPTPELWEIAMTEYDICEEQARKLDGLDVSFEPVKKYVGGVRVIDNKTGEAIFYFDYQTAFLVETDRWLRITEIERIWENEMSREEVFSDEYFAWLKYIASTLEFDEAKIEVNIEKKVGEIVAKGWLTEEEGAEWIRKKAFPMEVLSNGALVPMVIAAPNFTDSTTAPFKRMEALAFVKDAEMTEKYKDGVGLIKNPIDTFAILPNFILAWDKEIDDYQVYPVIVNRWNSNKLIKQNDLPIWESGMSIMAFYVNYDMETWFFGDTFSAQTYKKFGIDTVKEACFAMVQGDPSLLSQPGIVMEAMIADNYRYK